MFEKLLHFENHTSNAGLIWSIEGDLYLAYEMTPEGEVVEKAEHVFKNLTLAREWLLDKGVKSISLRQSTAYFEMIGQAAEQTH